MHIVCVYSSSKRVQGGSVRWIIKAGASWIIKVGASWISARCTCGYVGVCRSPLGNPEIAHLGVPALGEEHVGRLEVLPFSEQSANIQ
jgi:hypothetical protein